MKTNAAMKGIIDKCKKIVRKVRKSEKIKDTMKSLQDAFEHIPSHVLKKVKSYYNFCLLPI